MVRLQSCAMGEGVAFGSFAAAVEKTYKNVIMHCVPVVNRQLRPGYRINKKTN